MNTKSKAIWPAEDCALLLIDFQPETMGSINERDVKLVELNVCILAKMAVKLKVPVVLSTVAVKLGVESPTIPSLKAVLPDSEEIDRTSTNAFEDETFVKAVEITGRKKLVIAGISTSVCLTYAAVHAISEGYEVMFIEDAVGDISKEEHDVAVMRLIQAGAIPSTTVATMTEWFRDWASPLANRAREIYPSYLIDVNNLRGLPLPPFANQTTKKALAT